MFRVLLLTFLMLVSRTVFAAAFNPDWGNVGVFSDAQSCAACHRASSDQDPGIASVMRFPLADNGADVSPSQQWTHSVMAHAFNDPYFQAKVEDESALFPALSGFIEDKCLTCHTPMAHTHAHQANVDLTLDASCPLPNGCYRISTADTQDHAREGVSCTLCHQIRDLNLGNSASFSGNYSIAAAGDIDALTIYGPHQNPITGVMVNNTQYTPAFGSQTTTSGHCATCHTLYTPTLGADNDTPTGDNFLEQGAFLEWQNSVYFTGNSNEQQCQGCHMPQPEPGAYASRVAVMPNGNVNESWPVRSPFFTHSMVGGNTYLLELLRDYRVQLEIDTSTSVAGFDAKIAETRSLLQNGTASLTIARADVAADQLLVDVDVINHTGHKLPTGYPSRRMWIHLTVRDANNQVVFESGAVDANGRLSTDSDRLAAACLAVAKPPGFSSDDCYEPHRDVIDDADEIAIYEAVMADTNSDITHVLLYADSYLKENRIPPRGFTDAQAIAIESQTRPAGTGGDADFNAANGVEGSGSDTVHYVVDLAADTGPYQVDARLLFQAVQPSFINSMHTSAPRVDQFKAMAQLNPPTVEVLTSSSALSGNSGTTSDSSGGGGGGGCMLGNVNGRFDPVLPGLALGLIALPGLRRRQKAADYR